MYCNVGEWRSENGIRIVLLSFEEGMPFVEAGDGVGAVFPDGGTDFFEGELDVDVGFGVELVCVADDLFFDGSRGIVLQRNRPVVLADFVEREACAGVSLCHLCMTREALTTEKFGSEIAVLDVMMRAEAVDFGRVAEDNADVVQHGCLCDKLAVCAQFGMVVADTQGAVTYLRRVREENMPEFREFPVIFVY